MNTELYWTAVTLMGSAGAISYYASAAPHLYGPLRSGPFNIITTIATFGWIILVIAGFFLFRWYDPLIGIALGMIAVLPLRAIAMGSGLYPLVTMVISIAGIGCGIALLFV